MDDSVLYLAIIISACALLIIIIGITRILGLPGIESPEKRAGRIGERVAGIIIQEILDEDDIWTIAKIKEYNRIIKLMDYVNEGDPIKITLESNSDGRHIDSLEPIRIDDRILTAV